MPEKTKRQREAALKCLYKFYMVVIAIFAMSDAFSATCSSGYTETISSSDIFVAPVNGKCELGGYTLKTITDGTEILYTGLIIGDAVTLCNNGYMSNGSCVSYGVNNCANGDYSLVSSSDIFVAPVNGKCELGGYTLKTITDGTEILYNGLIIGDAVTLCNNGYMSNGSCVSYGVGNCANGYYDLVTNADVFTEPESPTITTCPNTYRVYSDTTRCDHNAGDTCVNIPTPTVSINWLDSKGDNVTTNACYYGEPITIPTDPAPRTGYIFNGWTVVSQ